jgi:hypothetical protein
MNDRPDPVTVVRAWLREQPPAPPDRDAVLARVTASLPAVRQRGARWRRPYLALPRRHDMHPTVRLATAVALVALFGVAVVGTLPGRPTPGPGMPAVGVAASPGPGGATPLVPSGIDVLTPAPRWHQQLVADGVGVLWGRDDDGRLLRFDPASRSVREWTIADDLAFGATTDIAPAAAGGVWLAGGRAVRLFDGTSFRRVIEAPEAVMRVIEAPDGGLWAVTASGVLHWQGSSWARLDGGCAGDGAYVWNTAVGRDGTLWLACERYPDPPGRSWLARTDGSRWTILQDSDAPAALTGVRWVAAHPDGGIWVIGDDAAVSRFDGSTWTDAGLPGGGDPASIAIGSDGAIWVSAVDRDRGAVTVHRLDGRSWSSYPMADRLPEGGEDLPAWVMPTRDGVFLGTAAGIGELVGGRWERAWASEPRTPTWVDREALAVSADEVWLLGGGGLWHVTGEGLTRDPVEASDLAIAPDGTVWAAGPGGVAYRADGGWVVADGGPADALVVDGAGTVWLGGAGCAVETLRRDGATWVRTPIAPGPCPGDGDSIGTLGIDREGDLWATAGDPFRGWLGRLDGSSWQGVGELAGRPIGIAWIVGADASGDLWAMFRQPDEVYGSTRVRHLARFDGTEWAIAQLPDPSAGASVGSDGALWASADRGPARLEGTGWAYPYEGFGLPSMRVAVARDGTVFLVGQPWDVLRLPAPAG